MIFLFFSHFRIIWHRLNGSSRLKVYMVSCKIPLTKVLSYWERGCGKEESYGSEKVEEISCFWNHLNYYFFLLSCPSPQMVARKVFKILRRIPLYQKRTMIPRVWNGSYLLFFFLCPPTAWQYMLTQSWEKHGKQTKLEAPFFCVVNQKGKIVKARKHCGNHGEEESQEVKP